MKTPARFKAENKYEKSTERKANRNLPMMGAVGNGNNVVATGRDNFYWIRLVNDDNRLTQCYSIVPLSDGDLIYIRRARDRDLSYYEFDKFIQGAGGTAPPIQVHDHSELIRGGPDLNPETISTRMLIVGTGCTYTTLRAAVAAVPGTPCTIKILGITTVEDGAITIPADVDVVGQGRGSIIGMGANVLSLSINSSLKDVTVETTMDATTKCCINCDGITGYELFNVLVRYTPHNAGANIGFYFHGASNGAAYHCVADPLAGSDDGTVDGFAAEDSAVVLLWDCEANDTDLDRGLYINDTAKVTTKHCTFRADGKDVLQAAAGTTWSHISTEADPANVTLPGTVTFLPSLRDEIGCGLWRDDVQAIPTGAWTAISFNTVRWDDANDMGCATDFYDAATPTRITIPAGLETRRYHIYGHIIWDPSTAGTARGVCILLNGVTTIGSLLVPFTATNGWSHLSVPTIYPLAATDFLELCAYQDTPGNLNVLSVGNYSPEFRIECK